ncbi:hypothetical protein ABID39_001451 [Bartonella japonica]|uniref:Uncharacterized protein n=1 Tax=Bartonella japonica TaxID=357761 RepID=A0ABV2FQE6_9HYPH
MRFLNIEHNFSRILQAFVVVAKGYSLWLLWRGNISDKVDGKNAGERAFEKFKL